MERPVPAPWPWWACLLVGTGLSLLLNLLPLFGGTLPRINRDQAYSFLMPAANFAFVARFTSGNFTLRRFGKLFVLSMTVQLMLELAITGKMPF